MSGSTQSGAGRREVAYRLFAAEYEDADLSYSESDEERAPNYVVTPSGARINRLFVVGVLTEVEQVSEDVLRGRVVDPTGAFVLYAGQYQPDEMAFLEATDPPAFVAVTGKARTFQPEDSERVFTLIRPETINGVDAETRDRWTVQAAEHTLNRISHVAAALDRDERGDNLRNALRETGVDEGLAAGIPVAIDHYGTTPTYLATLRETALDAVRAVAETTDGVAPLDVPPDASGDARASDLRDSGVDVGRVTDAAAGDAGSDTPVTAGSDTGTASKPEPTDSVVQTEPVDPGGEDASADGPEDAEAGGEEIGDFDPGEYELEDETREQIEEEYGTEFQTGTEVEEPGSADVDPGTSESESESGDGAAAGSPEPVAEPAGAEQAADDEGETVEEPDDLQAAVVDLMGELDDGAGADREALLAAATEQYGADPDDVEEAIQGALMDGQCYEPDETTLKPI
jgi:RPA family protein